MAHHPPLPARSSRSSPRRDRLRLGRRRDGIALPLTLWALVVAGALLTVATFVGFHEQRAAANGRRLHQALTHAESGLPSILSDWTPGRLNQRLPRPFDSLVTPAPDAGVVHRLGDGLFLYRVTGSDSGGAARSGFRTAITVKVGQLLGVRPTTAQIRAALSARDTVVLGAGSAVTGHDTPPSEWPDCPSGEHDVAGVMAGAVAESDSGSIDGSPPFIVRQDADTVVTVSDSALFHTLAAQATVEVPAGRWDTPPQKLGLECDSGSILNWGDPSDPTGVCGGYVPILHVSGDLTLAGGEGQGILLVDGNLEFSGPYRFYGLVLVRGGISVPSAGAGVALKGAVFASQVGASSAPVSGVQVSFSKCIVDRVLQSSGQLIPLRSRGWKQLFEVP
jgi:hypothetical protein